MILADQLSPGEFKPFVTFNLTKTLHEHPKRGVSLMQATTIASGKSTQRPPSH